MKYIRQRHRGTEVQRYRGIRAGAFKMIRSLLYLDCLGFVCFSCSHSLFPQKEIWASDWGKLGSWCEGGLSHSWRGGSFLLHVRFRENEALCKKRLSVLLGKHEGSLEYRRGWGSSFCMQFLLHSASVTTFFCTFQFLGTEKISVSLFHYFSK